MKYFYHYKPKLYYQAICWQKPKRIGLSVIQMGHLKEIHERVHMHFVLGMRGGTDLFKGATNRDYQKYNGGGSSGNEGTKLLRKAST